MSITRRSFLKGLLALPALAAIWPKEEAVKAHDTLYVADRGHLWRVDKNGSMRIDIRWGVHKKDRHAVRVIGA